MIWILLVIFQLKHFIADYPLQTPYMLGKFKEKGWVKPLAFHCGVQAAFTYFISFATFFYAFNLTSYFSKYHFIALGLAALDFAIHFIMDRIKASPKMLGRFEALSKEQFKGLSEARNLAQPGTQYMANLGLQHESERIVKEIDGKFRSNKYFWWSLGFDQMVHHLTDILLIFLIMKAISV